MPTYKLVLTFLDDEGSNLNFTFRYAKANVTSTEVQTLANSIITNNSIFLKTPVSKKGAKLVATTETEFSV